MAKTFDAEEVARHNSPESCWVILYGHVYDVTAFLPSHPGGSSIILQLAGTDATEDFDPVHPQGTLEDNLPPEAKIGRVDPASLARLEEKKKNAAKEAGVKGPEEDGKDAPPPLESLLNLDEIEAVATRQISKKAWAYYYSAGDDLASKALNTAAFRQILLRPRIFLDITTCSLATTLLGYPVGLPLYVAPAAMARLAHPDGEAGIARGIAPFGGAQVLSHNASMTPEQVAAAAAPGQVLGWQLYVQTERSKSEAMLARINALASFKFIVLTLDAPLPGKREADLRAQFQSGEAVFAASQAGSKGKPGGGGIGEQMFWGTAADLTWRATLPWLARHTRLPVVLKGLQTHEDAALAARYARDFPGSVRAIVLSNHGGRSLDTAPPAVHTLLEIRKYCPEVFERVEVWIDGGVKRGTDVVKALCLGARAVGVGRAALWGLGAGGEKGVERTFEILSAEIKTCMRFLGATKVEDLGPHFVNTRMVERDIYDGEAGMDKPRAWNAPSKAKL